MKDKKIKKMSFLLRKVHKKDSLLFILMLVNALLTGLIPYISIFTFQFITDGILNGKNFREILIILTISIALLFVLSAINTSLSSRVEIKLALINTILDKDISTNIRDIDFRSIKSSELSSLRTRIEEVKLSYGGFTSLINELKVIVSTVISFVIALVVLFITLSKERTLFSYIEIIVFTVFILMLAIFINRVRIFQEGQTEKISKINNEMNDTNRSMIGYMQFIFGPGVGKDIRLFNLSRYFADNIKSLGSTEKSGKQYMSLAKEEVKSPLLTNIGRNIFLAFIYIYSIYKSIKYKLTVGKLFVLINTLHNLMTTIIDFVDLYAVLANKIELYSPFFEVLDLNIGSKKNDKFTIDSIDKIEVRDLSFAYPETEEYVLKDINMIINSKEKIGIVGLNGSGKSTLIKLICGIYKPQKGKILINDIDIEEIDIDNFREKISPMFQDFSLLPFTVGENISFREKITEESKNIFEEWFKRNMDKSLNSYVRKEYSTNGIDFSGGEVQKIALIRAINKQSSCFIMDEPASYLDPKFEDEMTDLFTKLKNEFIIIQISHRLYSFKECDNIFVLDKGRVVEEGNHKNLIQKNAHYKKLWDMQAELYS